MRAGAVALALSFVLCAALAGCDRKIEPFVPGEKPAAPELSKIFPPGAERSREAPMGKAVLPPAPGERGNAPEAASAEVPAGPPIHGTVSLAPELAGKVPSGAVLFVIARTGTSGPPTAVKRFPSPTFPVTFEIGAGDRMIQQMPFAGPFHLVARLDGDGNATTRTPGDVQGEAPQPVSPGAEGVEIVLDQPL
jgi:cytochrome c-type biogenesis protein CcmH